LIETYIYLKKKKGCPVTIWPRWWKKVIRAQKPTNVTGGDKMKKVIVVAFVMLLLLSSVKVTHSAEPIKVLVDESRVFSISEEEQDELVEQFDFPRSANWKYSFENYDELWGFGTLSKKIQEVASVDIRKSGKLSYSALKNYDVLIIASFENSYSSQEAEAIKQFVENGGGLLVLADPDAPNNSISRSFDVLFSSETVNIGQKKVSPTSAKSFTWAKRGVVLSVPKVYFITVDDFKDHPITKGIEEFGMYRGIPITEYTSGKVLAETSKDTWADKSGEGIGSVGDDEEEGPFPVMLAIENASKGRAVFFASSLSFWNCIVESEEHNTQLIANAVEWLGEPGGPYKQYKAINEQAQQTLSDALSLYESHEFSQAVSEFNNAIDMFEESKEIYPNAEANEGIEEADNYIIKCETGIKANGIFDTAKGLYDKREYEKAIEEYEKAKSLYTEIAYTERAQECDTKVDESNAWIALREKAKQEFSDAETALSTAPSSLDPSGYENAKSKFEKAPSTWKEYDDPAQVQACQEKMDFCDDEIAKIEKNRMMLIVVIVVIVVVVVVVVVVIMKKRKPAEITEKEYQPPPAAGVDALAALSERYVRGEITKEEYEKLKSVLEE
jgi:tetratricopeptide (TPR) repeat protein